MHIVLLQTTISIPQVRSLKEKRRVIKSMKDRTVSQMNVSVAEVDQQEVWNRAELAVQGPIAGSAHASATLRLRSGQGSSFD